MYLSIFRYWTQTKKMEALCLNTIPLYLSISLPLPPLSHLNIAFLDHDLLPRARDGSLKIPEYRVLNKIPYVCHSARCQLLPTQPTTLVLRYCARNRGTNAKSPRTVPRTRAPRRKSRFLEAATMRRPRCDTSGVRNHNPTWRKKKKEKKKHALRGDGSANRAPRIARFLGRASSPSRRANLEWSLWLLQLISRLWDDDIDKFLLSLQFAILEKFYKYLSYFCVYFYVTCLL